jgi:hypothetical protein
MSPRPKRHFLSQVSHDAGYLSGYLASTNREHQRPISVSAADRSDDAVTVTAGLQCPPLRSTAQTMRANLWASATTAAFLCSLALRARSQPPSGVAITARLGVTARAPWIYSLHRYLLPRFLMSTSRGLPRVVICRDTPVQAMRPGCAPAQCRVVIDGCDEGSCVQYVCQE